MLALFSSIAGTIGAATVWIFGIGALVGWFVVALARFWGRMMWAYHLAQMEKKIAIATGDRSDIGSRIARISASDQRR
jgi:hypothetical protein